MHMCNLLLGKAIALHAQHARFAPGLAYQLRDGKVLTLACTCRGLSQQTAPESLSKLA